MSRTSFYTLHELLRPYIQKKSTEFREAIPSERRLAIYLYHITLGATFLAISNQFACGKSTVCGIVLNVTEAICYHVSKKFISFSTNEQAMCSIEFSILVSENRNPWCSCMFRWMSYLNYSTFTKWSIIFQSEGVLQHQCTRY